MRAGAIVLGLAVLLPATLGAAAAQEGTGAGAPSPPGDIPADLPPSAYLKGERAAPVERVFEARREKVWKALLRLLEESGDRVLEEDRDAGSIKTVLRSFDAMKDPSFWNVATTPPIATKEWPIWQPPHLSQGRYSLEILVDPGEPTRVSVRAYIEGQARHLIKQAKFWAERHSNGTIEGSFLDRLERALD